MKTIEDLKKILKFSMKLSRKKFDIFHDFYIVLHFGNEANFLRGENPPLNSMVQAYIDLDRR